MEDADAIAGVVGHCAWVVIREVALQRAVHQDGEFAGSGRDGLGLADPVGQATIEGAERSLRPPEIHGRQPQDRGGAIGGRLGATA